MPATVVFGSGRRRWFGLGLTVSVMVVALLLSRRWHTSTVTRDDHSDLTPLLERATLTVAPGIHYIGELDPAAAYAVEVPDGLVLIDSGAEADAHTLKYELSRLGLDWKRLRAVLLTHAHVDHTGGAERLRTATGAKVFAGQGDADVLRRGQSRAALFGSFIPPFSIELHPTNVDVELKGGEVLDFGEVRFRVLAAPGHSPGSVCYLMEREKLRVLFSGDVIVALRGGLKMAPHMDTPLGTYVAYQAPQYRGSAQAYLKTLHQLRQTPVPDLLLPGHPRMDATPQSPCLTQESWEAMLDDGIREMQTLLGRYERDGATFLDGIPKKLLRDLYYLGDLDGKAVYGFVAASRFFLLDAPGGRNLIPFLDAGLEKLNVTPGPLTVLLTSCDAEATAGLRELVEKRSAQVVVSPAGLATVKEVLPQGAVILSAEQLPGKGWFEVKPVALGGRGLAPIAYEVRWGNKTVLFTGRIPFPRKRGAAQELKSALDKSGGSPGDYMNSLDKLEAEKPDLWLPGVPADCPNAHLYDNVWNETIRSNRDALR
jgi:glyoxylase-like metal-dependent hydrolase (beta-lactamase superfamily II)